MRLSAAAPSISAISLAHVPDWQCYRYRVAETAVPLRNVIWGAP
jgi:type IV pilus assembly protein PilW